VRRVRYALGDGVVSGGFDETAEGGVGHLRVVDPEAGDAGRMGGGFVRIVLVRAHDKGATRDPDHVFERVGSEVRRDPGRRSICAGYVQAHCYGSWVK
jgi:hypothetical protein